MNAYDRVMMRTRHDSSGCIVFTGCRNKKGYGRVSNATGSTLAHRIVWSYFNGDVCNGLLVCHRCDNPPCVNIDHLFIGTPMDNTRDMAMKGRSNHPSGETLPTCVFQDDEVFKLFELRESGLSFEEISNVIGISQSHACRIYNGNRRKYIKNVMAQAIQGDD